MLNKQEKEDLQILDDIISTARTRGNGEFGKKVQELIRESLIIKKEDIPKRKRLSVWERMLRW